MVGTTIHIATVLSAAFCAGLLYGAFPTLLEHLKENTAGKRGAHFTLAMTTALVMLISGELVDKWGASTVLLLGCCLCAFGCGAIGAVMSSVSALGISSLLASAASILMVASLAESPAAFYPFSPARSANLACLALAIGAGAASLAGRWIEGKRGRDTLVIGVAGVSLLTALFAAFAPTGDPADAAAFRHLEVNSLSSDGPLNALLVLLMVVLLLAVPLEAALGPFSRRFAAEHCSQGLFRVLTIVGFWAAFLAARLTAGLFMPRGSEAVWVLILLSLTAMTFGNLLGAYTQGGSVGIVLAGAWGGAVVPTLLGLLLQGRQQHAGLLVGMAGAVGVVGYLTVLPWIDASVPGSKMRTIMRGVTLLAIAAAAPALVVAIVR
jgi:MFS family permease